MKNTLFRRLYKCIIAPTFGNKLKAQKMKIPFSVKYTKKEQKIELSLEPYSLDSIANLFGKKQLMLIDQLFLFQNKQDKISDYDYNEEFFYGLDLTLEMFLNFLDSIGEHKIYNMVFEIEDGTHFIINGDVLTISVDNANEKSLRNMTDLLTSTNGLSCNYQKALENQGRYVYFKKTPEMQLISNNDLWNKFKNSVN